MALFKKKKEEKSIPDGKCRIIKISRDALLELVFESMMENTELYFDVDDSTGVFLDSYMDWDANEFICIARNHPSDEDLPSHLDTDAKDVLPKLKDTTNSLYSENRYVELSEDELKNL